MKLPKIARSVACLSQLQRSVSYQHKAFAGQRFSHLQRTSTQLPAITTPAVKLGEFLACGLGRKLYVPATMSVRNRHGPSRWTVSIQITEQVDCQHLDNHADGPLKAWLRARARRAEPAASGMKTMKCNRACTRQAHSSKHKRAVATWR